jgi:hypothetical protein
MSNEGFIMKKYTVITEIEFQYETMEVEIEVEAY